MDNQRSSTVQQIRSTNSSLSPLNILPIDNQKKHISPNIFIQSCSYRPENIDRNAIVK